MNKAVQYLLHCMRPQEFSGVLHAENTHVLSHGFALHHARDGIAERLSLVWITVNGSICADFWQCGCVCCNHRAALPHGFQRGQAETFVKRGVDQHTGTLVQGNQLTVCDIAQMVNTVHVKAAAGKNPVITLTDDHTGGRILAQHGQCSDHRSEVFVGAGTGHGQDKKFSFEVTQQRLKSVREIDLAAIHMVCTQVRHSDALWRNCGVSIQFFGRERRVCQNACAEIAADAKKRPVPKAQCRCEVFGDCKCLCIVKKHPLTAFKQWPRIAKIDQTIVPSDEGQDCLLPEVTIASARLLHRQRRPRIIQCIRRLRRDQLKLNSSTGPMPLALRIQMMLDQGRDDFYGNAFHASDGAGEEACVDPNDRYGFLSCRGHLQPVKFRSGRLNV
nr:hypothetical protein [Limnohabitans sp. Jir72]